MLARSPLNALPLGPYPTAGKSPLYIGGPVTKNLLHVLHGRRDVEGSLEIMDVSGLRSLAFVWAVEGPPLCGSHCSHFPSVERHPI